MVSVLIEDLLMSPILLYVKFRIPKESIAKEPEMISKFQQQVTSLALGIG